MASDDTHTTHTINLPYRPAPVFHPKPAPNPKEKPKITPIPRITSAASMPEDADPAPLSQSPQQQLAEGLEGKYVDEFGNILDWNGTVLGRVEGDLPSMVGRPVTESGDVLDEDGEVVGKVSENYAKPPLKELDGGLRVDDAGNIYNQEGSVIGKLNEPPKKDPAPEEDKPKLCDCPPRKPASAPSPSEIYLDVKSTFDGIQLIIKIPTILNQEQESRPQQQAPEQAQEQSGNEEDASS